MRAFVDTNILVYAATRDTRSQRAGEVLSDNAGLAVQSRNEFALVARRKLDWNWPEIDEALRLFENFCEAPVPLTMAVHRTGIELAERYQLRIYDAMIVAAALEFDAQTLWSEDMQSGLVIASRLTIRNPFRA